ncbi:MAG: sensor histidine kinase [Polyangiales bacterium]
MSELRASTAIAWLAVGITAMLAAVAALVASEGVGHLEQLGHWRWVIAGAGYGTVGVGSFLILRRGARWSLRARVFSLALQCVAALVDESLYYVLAVQLPFVLPARWALRWLLAQVLLSVSAFLTLVFFYGQWRASPLSPWAVFTIVGGVEIGWQSFAFFVGRIAHVADTRREELEQMQSLVAERSRLEERLAIARDLHDVLGHHLAALSVNLDLAQRRDPDGPAAAVIGDARVIAASLLSDVRGVVGSMRESPRTTLAAELDELTAVTRGIVLHQAIEAEPVTPHAHALARCVREALTNSIRHGGARSSQLRVWRDAAGVVATLRDDGPGADAVVEGNGLTGMRERVEELGGTLELRAGPGFPITIRFPEHA